MNSIEHSPKSAQAATGLLAVLGGPLRGQGSGARSRARRLLALPTALLAILAVFALNVAPALGYARGHVFEREFGKLGAGPGEFDPPSGLAVNEATGDVYVADYGNNRVQWFNSSGSKLEGQITESSGAGTGNLTLSGEGSGTLTLLAGGTGSYNGGEPYIHDLNITSGTFAVGQEIAGEAIEPGTVITEVLPGELKISKNPERAVAGGAVTVGSKEVSGLATASGAFAVGAGIAGAGIPAGTRITEVDVATRTLQLSNAATLGGSGVPIRAGSYEVTGLATTAGAFGEGQTIEGAGIPAGTKITAVDALTGALEISQLPTAAGMVALTAQEQLLQPQGIAVDNSCFVRKLSEPKCHEEDPSNGDLYVIGGDHSIEDNGIERSVNTIKKFTSTGEYVGQITTSALPGFGGLPEAHFYGVAVDSSGKLWVVEDESEIHLAGLGQFSDAVANVFLPRAASPGFIRFDENPVLSEGLAVDSEDNLFVSLEGNILDQGPALEFSPTCEARAGEQHNFCVPEGEGLGYVVAGGIATELPSNDVYADDGAAVRRLAPGGAAVEVLSGGHLPTAACEGYHAPSGRCGSGVAVDSATGRVYVVDESTDAVQVYQLELPGPPTVGRESLTGVTANSATFTAEVNPRSEVGEEPTQYWFEYGPCGGGPGSCASSPFVDRSPVESLPAEYEYVPGRAHVQGLGASTAYHFRVVVENSHENGSHEKAVDGAEGTFVTRGTGEFGLPDGRAWELVSPTDKHGSLIEPVNSLNEASLGALTQASATGDALTYMTLAPTEVELAGYLLFQQVLSARTASGWESHDLASPHTKAAELSFIGQEYRFFSEDLSLGVMQPFGGFDQALSAEASEQTPYEHSDFAAASGPTEGFCAASCYKPLVTGADDTTSPFVPFSTTGACPKGSVSCGPEFVGATPDAKHVLLSSPVALTAGGKELYEWSAGLPSGQQLQPLDKLPESEGGEVAAGGVPGFGNHQLSDDGSVFFNAHGHLYLQQPARDETARVAVAPSGVSEGEPVFLYASSDGSTVLFRDPKALTGAGGGVYVCDLGEVEGRLGCEQLTLTGLSFEGKLIGGGEEANDLYLSTSGGLVVDRDSGGAWKQTLIATGESNPKTMRVSPNGEWFAFMSEGSLTGYDNDDVSEQEALNEAGSRTRVHPDEEVYEYDAAVGSLTCASCNPTGARPQGVEFNKDGGSQAAMPLVGGYDSWGSRVWLAADLPDPVKYGAVSALYQPRYLSSSGRLLFNSSDALVPKDVNGTWDVYEYEPEGVGSCSSATGSGSSVYEPASAFEVEGGKGSSGAGCVSLISSGESSEESAFLDASEGGGDVFLLSSAKLTPQDAEGGLSVFDAHECTAASKCPPAQQQQPPPCDTEASCKAAPSPQPAIYGLSGSATFSGPGNVTPAPAPAPGKLTKKTVKCKKGYTKNKKSRCVKKRSKRRKAKKSRDNRRASR